MRVLGVIPARGGSKGVPRKNIKMLGGKPLIAWTIEVCAASKRLTRTVVSTDDEEIAQIAREYGGDVPFMRPDDLATDSAASIAVMRHAVEAVEADGDEHYDAMVMLQPTTPFRTTGDIDSSLEILEKTGCDSVISVNDVGGHLPARMKYLQGDKLIDPPFCEEIENQPRQELQSMYIRNGAIYATRRDVLMGGSFKGKDSRAWLMEETRSANIDMPIDFYFAEMLFDKGLI